MLRIETLNSKRRTKLESTEYQPSDKHIKLKGNSFVFSQYRYMQQFFQEIERGVHFKLSPDFFSTLQLNHQNTHETFSKQN